MLIGFLFFSVVFLTVYTGAVIGVVHVVKNRNPLGSSIIKGLLFGTLLDLVLKGAVLILDLAIQFTDESMALIKLGTFVVTGLIGFAISVWLLCKDSSYPMVRNHN
jgi:hypothetical protein